MPRMPHIRSLSILARISDSIYAPKEPDSPNISWFFEKDVDQSGTLTLEELWVKYAENNWYNLRYQKAIETLIQEADTNRDRGIDMSEYIK